MRDQSQEFRELLILRQGIMNGMDVEALRISLRFSFPKRFDVQFIRIADHRVKLPLSWGLRIKAWWASRDTEFLNTSIDRWQRGGLLPSNYDLSDLHHFHLDLHDGYLDVLAEDFEFMMISR